MAEFPTLPKGTVGVHGTAYDLDGFEHPGGDYLLRAYEGRDVTALFETHHLNMPAARAALDRRRAVGSYAFPAAFDFDPYAALRRRAWRLLPTRGSRRASLPFGWLAFGLATHALVLSRVRWDLGTALACALAALANAALGGFGHNALHRLEPAALLLDWNGLSTYEWLHEHVHSHHMYTNTRHDHDALALEPFFAWLPGRRGWLPAWARHPLFASAEIVVAMQGYLGHRMRWRALSDSRAPAWLRLAPCVFLLRTASHAAVQTAWMASSTLLVCIALSGWYFAFLAHLNHVHPRTAGLLPDFAAHQLQHTVDLRVPAPLAPVLLFLDRQRLHHLFPAVDHRRLPALRALVTPCAVPVTLLAGTLRCALQN